MNKVHFLERWTRIFILRSTSAPPQFSASIAVRNLGATRLAACAITGTRNKSVVLFTLPVRLWREVYAQSKQSAKLFLQSSELVLPHPLTRRLVRIPPPPLWFRRGTLACGGGGGGVPIRTICTLWVYVSAVFRIRKFIASVSFGNSLLFVRIRIRIRIWIFPSTSKKLWKTLISTVLWLLNYSLSLKS
jgi:hypothetical protein